MMVWTHIRALGRLQILTRASYVILLFVPMLAGLWPAIRIAINRYNEAITDARTALDAAAERRLEVMASTIVQKSNEGTQVLDVIQALDTKINAIVADYSLKTIEHVSLPTVWVVAFLASLLVSIAHLLYQTLAPSRIQQATLREFVDGEMRRYAEYRSRGHLERAHALARMDNAEIEGPHRLTGIGDPEEGGEELKKELAVIESGAAREYYDAASKNMGGALACGILYVIGVLLIIWIIITQTINVIAAAGWI